MVQVDECNAIDMANIMYSFVAMEYDPGLLILDSIAWHVNNRYQEYGPVEMAQVLPHQWLHAAIFRMLPQYFACYRSLHSPSTCGCMLLDNGKG